jgi:hypothetical protein
VTLVWVILAVMVAGCSVSPDIVLRDKDGHEAVCEHVTGIYGVRTHTLLTIQRQCVTQADGHPFVLRRQQNGSAVSDATGSLDDTR